MGSQETVKNALRDLWMAPYPLASAIHIPYHTMNSGSEMLETRKASGKKILVIIDSQKQGRKVFEIQHYSYEELAK